MRYLAVICMMAASLFGRAATAQVNSITAQIVKQTGSQITVQVVNQSSKPVAAFTVGIDATYADGKSFHNEESIQAKPIEPGAFYNFTYETTQAAHGDRLDVRVAPVMVLYTDQTHESVDAATYHRFADQFVAQAKALQIALKAVQQSLADGSSPQMSIEDALKQSRLATASPFPGVKRVVVGRPVPPDDKTLEDVLTDLQKVKSREDMASYAAKLQQRLQRSPVGGN